MVRANERYGIWVQVQRYRIWVQVQPSTWRARCELRAKDAVVPYIDEGDELISPEGGHSSTGVSTWVVEDELMPFL